MKTGFKYFIEHKKLHTWVSFDGTLTNNPNDDGIVSFDEKWIAEKHLQKIEPQISSDFSGRNIHYDYTGQAIWDALRRQIADKNNGADLYADFVITEHEFVDGGFRPAPSTAGQKEGEEISDAEQELLEASGQWQELEHSLGLKCPQLSVLLTMAKTRIDRLTHELSAPTPPEETGKGEEECLDYGKPIASFQNGYCDDCWKKQLLVTPEQPASPQHEEGNEETDKDWQYIYSAIAHAMFWCNANKEGIQAATEDIHKYFSSRIQADNKK